MRDIIRYALFMEVDMNKTQRIVANVDATMRMEGMPLKRSDKARVTACLEGKVSFQSSIDALVLKHTIKASAKK